jgi:hypothetical protein
VHSIHESMHNIHKTMKKGKEKAKVPAHKLKMLIDAQPENTNEVKRKLSKYLDCSLDKVNRWYRNKEAVITPSDQFSLVKYFKLSNISDLYYSFEATKAKSKPLGAHS